MLGFFKGDTICVESGVWWLESHVDTNTNIYTRGFVPEENMTPFFSFSLEIPDCVNVISEIEDNHLLRCIYLNYSKNLYCFMSVTGVEAFLTAISVVSLHYSQVFTSAFNLQREEQRPLRHSSVQSHTER